MKIGDMKIDKLTKDQTLTVEISLSRQFYIRLFLSKLFFNIGAWILGCSLDFNNDNVSTEEHF